MPTAAFQKFNSFVEALAEKTHNLGADSLKVYLTATVPNASTMTKKADLSETLTTTGGYTAGGIAPTITSSAQTGGLYKLILADISWTATGSGFGPFQYAVLYNDTDAVTPKALIGWWDNAAPVTLTVGQSFTVDYDATTGAIQLQ